MQGIDSINTPPYETIATSNASSHFDIQNTDIAALRQALENAQGSFESLFTHTTSEESSLPSQDGPSLLC